MHLESLLNKKKKNGEWFKKKGIYHLVILILNWIKILIFFIRIEALECSLRQKTNELVDEKQKLRQLKEDFKYNLKLLEERDKGIRQIWTIFSWWVWELFHFIHWSFVEIFYKKSNKKTVGW